MTSATGMRIHYVSSISVKYREVEGRTKWMEFTFTDADGGTHEVTAFVERPIEIQGSEFINFMAAEPAPA